MSPDEATLNSEEIKPVAMAIIKLRLSEGISKGVSQSVSQKKIQLNRKFLNICSNFLEWVRNDLNTFLSLAIPMLPRCHKVNIKLILGVII